MGAMDLVVMLNAPLSGMASGGPVISPRKLHGWAVRAFIPFGKRMVYAPGSPICSHSRSSVPSPYGLWPKAVRINPRGAGAAVAVVPAWPRLRPW